MKGRPSTGFKYVQSPHRLVAEDAAVSLLKPGFESLWGYLYKSVNESNQEPRGSLHPPLEVEVLMQPPEVPHRGIGFESLWGYLFKTNYSMCNKRKWERGKTMSFHFPISPFFLFKQNLLRGA